jgi:transposase
MAKARLSMRKIKEVLRLKYHCALSRRQIAQICQVSRSTVADYLYRAEKAGISWPLPEGLTDPELEQKLFPSHTVTAFAAKPLPDFDYLYQELKAHKKFNLTLDLLWREYQEQYPDGYQYSQFCELYRRFQKKLDYSMRQDHRGGEKLFVDYGEGLSLVDPQSGKPISTQIYVAVWGASNYT